MLVLKRRHEMEQNQAEQRAQKLDETKMSTACRLEERQREEREKLKLRYVKMNSRPGDGSHFVSVQDVLCRCRMYHLLFSTKYLK